MAYNPQSAVNAIYKLKGQWDSANTAGDETKKNEAATKAQAYYNQLRNNGYADVADQLTAADYNQAKAINDKWTTMGKTKTRDYLYDLGKSKGLSPSEMDNIIGWNGVTGQVSLGGKVIGTPDAIVDGVSYWSDTSVLDNAFNDYISRTGTTASDDVLYKQTMQNNIKKNDEQWETMRQNAKDILAKYNQEYDDLKNTNPFETETAKSILAKYDLAGLQNRDNAVATNAGSNGGNIDSYAAANALRQQSALVNQGQQVVLNEYQQKLDNAQNILNNLGVQMSRDYSDQNMNIQTGNAQAQQLFDNSETAKNNDVARKSEIASVSGYTPDEWVVSNNPYLNDDGTLKDEYKDVDFSAVMANAKAAGNTNAYNAAAVARYYKIMGNYGLYGQYDDGNYALPGQQQTEAARQFDAQIKAAADALNAKSADSAANRQNAIDQINAKKDADIAVIQEQVKNGIQPKGTTTTTTDGSIWLGGDGSTPVESAWDTFTGYFPSDTDENKKIIAFLKEQLKPYYDSGKEINEEVIEKLIVGDDVKNSNSTKYDIDIAEAKNICEKLGLDSSWVNKYKDRWGFNSGKGMK